MATSQNGWPVVPRSAVDEASLIRDVRVPNGMLRGDVATVFRWLARQYDARVERIAAGQCWGWHVKNIEGSSTISNHASGTAIDINAPQNPMGSGTTRRSMTQRQIDECHALERESGGVLRWGGDFSRNDPMHWEIVGSRAEVAAFAKQIRDQEDNDMPTPQEYAAAVWDHPLANGNKAGGHLVTLLARSGEQQARMANVPAQFAAIAGAVAEIVPQDVDEDALAAALVARLPVDTDDITPDELRQAIVGAAHDLFATATS